MNPTETALAECLDKISLVANEVMGVFEWVANWYQQAHGGALEDLCVIFDQNDLTWSLVDKKHCIATCHIEQGEEPIFGIPEEAHRWWLNKMN